jgi:hypothetical protein
MSEPALGDPTKDGQFKPAENTPVQISLGLTEGSKKFSLSLPPTLRALDPGDHTHWVPYVILWVTRPFLPVLDRNCETSHPLCSYPQLFPPLSTIPEICWSLVCLLSFHARERKLDYQEGPPGKESSCWLVEL